MRRRSWNVLSPPTTILVGTPSKARWITVGANDPNILALETTSPAPQFQTINVFISVSAGLRHRPILEEDQRMPQDHALDPMVITVVTRDVRSSRTLTTMYTPVLPTVRGGPIHGTVRLTAPQHSVAGNAPLSAHFNSDIGSSEKGLPFNLGKNTSAKMATAQAILSQEAYGFCFFLCTVIELIVLFCRQQ